MSSLTDCCQVCGTTTPPVNLPGTPGSAGAAGAAGTDGTNAYTLTTADFVVPAVGANVAISVANNSWMVVGQNLFVAGPANFEVVSKTGLTAISATFLGYTGDVASATNITAGAQVSPGGLQGPLVSPVPIADGGTNATTVSGALSSLGIAQDATAAYASGTVYSLTATPALIAFGTTSPTITIPTTGVYSLRAHVRCDYVGATFAAVQTITIKIRRTAAVAGDVTNATISHRTEIITTLTYTAMNCDLPEVRFSATAADIIQLWGSISVVPSAGSVDVMECCLIAEPVHLP